MYRDVSLNDKIIKNNQGSDDHNSQNNVTLGRREGAMIRSQDGRRVSESFVHCLVLVVDFVIIHWAERVILCTFLNTFINKNVLKFYYKAKIFIFTEEMVYISSLLIYYLCSLVWLTGILELNLLYKTLWQNSSFLFPHYFTFY